VIITLKRLHKLQVQIYRMRVIKAIAKCIQRSIDTENEVRVFGTETQNLESVSVHCYTVLETVYRNRLHYAYSWAYTYITTAV
jgi:hypothetical protein